MSLYHAPTQPRAGGLSRFRRRFARRTVEDPFVVLAIQVRLGVVAAQLRAIDDDLRMFARGRRWIATRNAYDALLGDACRAAGVPATASPTEDERLHMELELASRGWSW
jgi:hypothetical protein